ncbi:MAG: Fe2+-dependent dioxygenase [Rhodospirillaceae bacterium]|jgi:PKHD-type hydroxylase|nr:Fe2+-dependent dioxygenase [Rhodospirillaceae bacterium]MBT5457347.1 Fe2+-dependent dioxygenase [Rhodospirillaceae bacterium]
MMMCIPDLLTLEEVASLRDIAAGGEFVDGATTAGRRIKNLKTNLQMKNDSSGKETADAIVLEALQRNMEFQSVALPKSIANPMLSRYADGMSYDSHVDAAVMGKNGGMRPDVSVTIFLNDPASYDGGELTIESGVGEQAVKLMAGEAVVYPTSALHWVSPVTRGERLAAVTWAQSAVRSPEKRTLLYDLRAAMNQIADAAPDAEATHLLFKTHANLMRMWVEI